MKYSDLGRRIDSARVFSVLVGLALPCLACQLRSVQAEAASTAEQGSPQTPSVATGGSGGSAAVAPGVAAAGAAAEGPPAQRCLSAQEVDEYDVLGAKLSGPLSVVRVARDDTLKLRQSASPDAAVIAQLAPDEAGITALRQVCFVNETPWYQVRVRCLTGWVNSQFIRRTTAPHDQSQQYRSRFGALSAVSAQELLKQLTDAMNTPSQTEGKYQATIIDTQIQGDSATATLYACCELDDSVAGEQTLLTLKKSASRWRLDAAQTRNLCYRALNQDGTLCN